MPLNRPALTLGQGPRGVQDARRWVVNTCEDIGRPGFSDCAEAGVSELVTNALLHGEPPISVRVRGTAEHPRVEVRDGSVDAPVLPAETSETGAPDVLLTVGRGLGIVGRASDAWGAEIEDDGKVVWFAPSAEFADRDGIPGVITGVDLKRARRRGARDPVRVKLLGVPVAAYIGFRQHFRELRREVRLLALAHESDYPLAKSLSDLFASLERQLRDGMGVEQVEAAEAAGKDHVDLQVDIPRSMGRPLSRFIELLDLADEFCRQQRLLSLARTPEQRRFQQWFLGEFVRISNGEAPLPWTAVPEGTYSVGSAPPRVLVAVAVGGALGAVLRWWLTDAFPDGAGFAWTTFAVNVSGTFVLACLPAFAVVQRHEALDAGLGPGLLGGYTTLSAYALQSRALVADGSPMVAAAYVGGTLAACLLVVLLVRLVVPSRPAHREERL